MTSRIKAPQHSLGPRQKPVAIVDAVPRVARTDVVARAETRKSEFSIFGDPLWGIAIISGILFAALAALMAVG